MKNFTTIQQSKSLDIIAKELSVNKPVLVDTLIRRFEEAEMIENGSDDWGKTVDQIIQEWDVTPIGIAVLFLRTPMPRVVENLLQLKFVSVDEDCPECGAETTTDRTREEGKDYIETSCTHCEFVGRVEDQYKDEFI